MLVGMGDVHASVCIFCLRPEGDARAWCPDNPGRGCTYGLAHEHPAGPRPKPKTATVANARCLKCGLHPKNPAYRVIVCAHEHAA
jgi:hypothetical protein